jgi:hypothetical protein
MDSAYPLRFDVDYPDRDLSRLKTALRILLVIPVLILLLFVQHATVSDAGDGIRVAVFGGGVLFAPVLLMLLFRQKYPRWWFDWNLELTRFASRVAVYGALMNDEYPSTTDQQTVHLEIDYPDAEADLSRVLPLIKWFLAIPHYVVLFVLAIAAFFALIAAWFAIVFTARYPRGIFDFLVGLHRWTLRVNAYTFLLVTDRYPPFSLNP